MSESKEQSEVSVASFRDEIKQLLSETQNSKLPLIIALMAVMLAIISMADDESDKAAMTAQIEAANRYAFFQAKNIRETDSQIAAVLLDKLGHVDLAAEWQDKARRYDKEKSDILTAAKLNEQQRQTAQQRGDYYKVGSALLQIAIVLASASLVFGGGLLLHLSLGLTAIAMIYAINGYGLYINIPTDPGGFVDSAKAVFHQVRFGPA